MSDFSYRDPRPIEETTLKSASHLPPCTRGKLGKVHTDICMYCDLSNGTTGSQRCRVVSLLTVALPGSVQTCHTSRWSNMVARETRRQGRFFFSLLSCSGLGSWPNRRRVPSSVVLLPSVNVRCQRQLGSHLCTLWLWSGLV